MSDVLDIIRKTIFDIALFAVIIPLTIGLTVFRKKPPYIRWLVVHLIFATIIQLTAYWLWKNGKNNLFLLHIYTVEELIMLSIFYSLLLNKLLQKHVFIAVALVFVVLAVLNALYLQPLKTHNTYMRSLESLIIIIWAVVYFYRRLGEDIDKLPVNQSGLLAINSGFLIYFTTSLLLFSLSNLVDSQSKQIRVSLWAIHALVSIIMYLLIAIGLWKHRKTAI